MPVEFTLAIAQLNPGVGALAENRHKMVHAARHARDLGADMVVFTELVVSGYPPEDLLHKPLFLQELAATERQLHQELAVIGIDAIYGTVRQSAAGLHNVGVLVVDGQEMGFASKGRLPNYGVFDEKRYFVSGCEALLFSRHGVVFGITICEDIWAPGGPVARLAASGAALVFNLNASPYHVGKQYEREEVVRQRVRENGLPIVYVNQVGGQDELLFDGGSFAINQDGQLVGRCHSCAEDLRLLRVSQTPETAVRLQAWGEGGWLLDPDSKWQQLLSGQEGESGWSPHRPLGLAATPEQEIYAALCLGLGDYVGKNGFSGVLLGLSGGIDSALTAVICADTLGAAQVEAVMMPSQYTVTTSREDAAATAQILGISLTEIAIDGLFGLFRQQLAAALHGYDEDVTEENIQPRIRATLLMAIANKKRKLLITTGNKSEISVGYATLYGDMAGGYSVLKDVLKGWVYRLAVARNQWAVARGETPPIPQRVLEKEPTAELRPNQRDCDSLPPYPLLDRILELYVEQESSLQEMVAVGINRETAVRVIELVDRNEYKRRQAPPGVRITRRAFGRDRRYPLTNCFRIA